MIKKIDSLNTFVIVLIGKLDDSIDLRDYSLKNTVILPSIDYNNLKYYIPYFDYIVADECHYFTTDAKFNEYTDVSYDFLMKRKDSVVLWVSATAKTFFRWLADKGKVKKKYIYRIDKDYSYVKKLYFYMVEC